MSPARGPGAASGSTSRTTAWDIVRRVHRDHAWTGPAVDGALRSSTLDARDRAFASNLALQTLRWQGTLDWALAQVLRRPLERVEPGLLDVLRLGAWQLLYGRMPDRAAVAATVDVARTALGDRTVGFANGVLRALARRRAELPWPAADSVEGRALRAGYPSWVVRAADERFAAAATGELEAGNEPAGLTVRAADAAAVGGRLAAAGAAVTPGALAPEALHVDGLAPNDVLAVAPDAVIQDEASIVVGRVLAAAVPSAARVLDVCAAPGGKATHLATLGLDAVAADRNARRLALVADLAGRLGLDVPAAAADGTRPPWRPGAYAGVLLDAPCSGLGVVRRRPELRWRRTAADVSSLTGVQDALLDASAPLVSPGGALVYSVCTWTVAETVDVVTRFLTRTPGFTPQPVTSVPDRSAAAGPGLQLMTSEHGCDGMYIAVLRRRDG